MNPVTMNVHPAGTSILAPYVMISVAQCVVFTVFVNPVYQVPNLSPMQLAVSAWMTITMILYTRLVVSPHVLNVIRQVSASHAGLVT